jgi:hypothetical protein
MFGTGETCCLSMVVEDENKDQLHGQNIGKPNQYVRSKETRDRQNPSRVSSPCRHRRSTPPPMALSLGGVANHWPSPMRGFSFFV